MGDDCVTACAQKPNRVPGLRRASLRRASAMRSVSARSSTWSVGASRTAATTSRQARSESEATERKAVVQPATPRRPAKGMAESNWPDCPRVPTHCCSCGSRRGENQAPSRRSTERKVIASPAPTSTRPTIATPSSLASPTAACPSAIDRAPAAMSTRGPKRSMSTPTGIWRDA